VSWSRGEIVKIQLSAAVLGYEIANDLAVSSTRNEIATGSAVRSNKIHSQMEQD
jgi:hypothetical protein